MSNITDNSSQNNSSGAKSFSRNIDATNLHADQFMSDDLNLGGGTDSNWDEMLNEFNRIESEAQFFSDNTGSRDNNSVNAYYNESEASGFVPATTEYNDSFDDGFNDGFNDSVNDGFDDGFNDGFDDDLEENIYPTENRNNEENAKRAAQQEKRPVKASNEKNISGRLLALLAAVIFGFGVFLIIRLGDYATEIQPVSESEIQNKVSDSDKAESSSSEPDIVSSAETVSEEETVESVTESNYKQLNYGERSDEVLKMQKRLCELGYITEASCTGYYGKFTRTKIREFQQAAGLNVTGTADPATLAKLYSNDAPKAN